MAVDKFNILFLTKERIILCFLILSSVADSENSSKPNIVVFLVDDLGVGDIGAFGNTTLSTPNVDNICKDGVKLEHDLAGSDLCTPSRAALLTGRYAIRSGE